MDYKPRPILSRSLNTTYKKKRIFWFNSDFNDAFTSNNNKITDITFNIPPFQLYNNNNMRVISYTRNDANVQPIVIKLKEPYCDNRLITNTDKEGNPVIYVNHTGVQGMTSISPNFLLIPQQIPRFVFRLDDNFNQLDSGFYFSSITNGSIFQVAGGSPDDKYLLFNSSGSFTLNANLNVDVLVVGGGGGGSTGGGGAGQVVYQTNQIFNSGNYTITIGAGGAGVAPNSITTTRGNDGNDSFIQLAGNDIIRARKGGGGAGNTLLATAPSPPYGSTGGNGINSGGGENTFPQGNVLGFVGGVGGAGTSYNSAGGGGGAGEKGQPGTAGPNATLGSGAIAGRGGNGIIVPITGANIYYGGGGGGGTNINNTTGNTILERPAGGLGGGGEGSRLANEGGLSATANTGGGGGGGDWEATTAGNGGSGVVIIKFRETRQEGITPVNNKPPSFILGLELEDIDMKKDNIVSIYR